jgi:hypothetical protein
MKKIFTILFLSSALFGGTYLTVGGYSYHFDRKVKLTKKYLNENIEEVEYKKPNEHHKAIGAYHDITPRYSVSVTSYRNSFNWDSTSLMIHKNYYLENFKASLSIGAVNGYGTDGNQNEFMPVLYPSVTYHFKKVYFEISGTHKLLFVQVRFKLLHY